MNGSWADVRSGEWSISLGENGGKALTQNAARLAAAGSHIMGAVTGKPEGTAVQVRVRENGSWGEWLPLAVAIDQGPDAGSEEADGLAVPQCGGVV